jgi:hypothetical protein
VHRSQRRRGCRRPPPDVQSRRSCQSATPTCADELQPADLAHRTSLLLIR